MATERLTKEQLAEIQKRADSVKGHFEGGPWLAPMEAALLGDKLARADAPSLLAEVAALQAERDAELRALLDAAIVIEGLAVRLKLAEAVCESLDGIDYAPVGRTGTTILAWRKSRDENARKDEAGEVTK